MKYLWMALLLCGLCGCPATTPTDDGGTEPLHPTATWDAGQDQDPVADSGTQAPVCDGHKYCSDATTQAFCTEGTTHEQTCHGKTCDSGRCGACTGDSDCKSIAILCRCADGHEGSNTIPSICGDSQGTRKWCSHPSIDVSFCDSHGGIDEDFGYLGTGCISDVDP